MLSLYKIGIIILLVIKNGEGQSCPCEYLPSDRYEDEFKWDCESLELTTVPTICFQQISNVSEVYLTNNNITSVSASDFDVLIDLRGLFIDYNKITFFDPATLDSLVFLEYFHAEKNPLMGLTSTILQDQTELIEVVLFSSDIQDLPLMTSAQDLNKLDVRSCQIIKVPRPLFAESLTSDEFVLTMVGNSFQDVAADVILPLPSGATINFDSEVLVWAQDDLEKTEFIDKQYLINIDLNTNLLVCVIDGYPKDSRMCDSAYSSYYIVE